MFVKQTGKPTKNLEIMKKLQNLIDNLLERLEMGLLTQQQTRLEMLDLQQDIFSKFGEYSDNSDSLISELLEVNSVYMEIFKLK